MKFRALGLVIVLVALANQAWAETRVAIMDFSTDDNSYRSMQVAADFTSLLRAQLANVSGVTWWSAPNWMSPGRNLSCPTWKI